MYIHVFGTGSNVYIHNKYFNHLMKDLETQLKGLLAYFLLHIYVFCCVHYLEWF